jgi:hypothetical protein
LKFRFQTLSLSMLIWYAGLACNDLSGLAGKQGLPGGTPNPNSYNTAAGALALYNGVLYAFQTHGGDTTPSIGSAQSIAQQGAFVDFVRMSGLLTDESQSVGNADAVDARLLSDGTAVGEVDQEYQELQGIRNSAGLAIGALATYDSAASPALRGQLYALQGYSEIFLADLFCSGVPLSTFDFNRDFTYHAGSTTVDLYNAAIAKFDTALALSGDSARIMNLARVGKGRAFLDLAKYDSAATAVDSVPDGYVYQFSAFSGCPGVTTADMEGVNGLPYRSSGDPRSASSTCVVTQNGTSTSVIVPSKYFLDGGVSPITVADWIEARLIRAEAAYHGVAVGQGTWVDQLNDLRQTAITPTMPANLVDPVTPSAQVTMLFQERAYWLYLTGHRQGDMRRQIRNYNFNANAIYPIGPYPLFGISRYGEDITAPIPAAEHINPLFTGCISRGA